LRRGSPRDPLGQARIAWLLVLGVDERPAHALDELVSVMLIREPLRGHCSLSMASRSLPAIQIEPQLWASWAPLCAEMRHRQVRIRAIDAAGTATPLALKLKIT